MSIEYTRESEKFLEKHNAAQTKRIRRAVEKLPDGDVKKLKGLPNAFRLRVGDFRVLFYKNDGDITVFEIDFRGNIYKNL
ncbi:MAG: type II toxin-antitoxin system RelE family toxin [Thermoguttaceae bacterium]